MVLGFTTWVKAQLTPAPEWYVPLTSLSSNQPAEAGVQLDSLFNYIKDDPEQLFRWNLLRSRVFIALGKYDTALTYCFNGLKSLGPDQFLKKAHYQKQAGIIYYYLKQREKAMETFRQALLLADESGQKDTMLTSTLWSNLGAVYIELGKIEDAKKALKTSIQAGHAYYSSRREEAEPTFAYRLLGTLYETQEDFENALPYLSQALELSYPTGDTVQIIGALLFYGDALLKSGKQDQALVQYQKARKLAKNSDSPDIRMETFVHLKNAYRATGDFAQALNISDSVLALQVSVYQKDLVGRISEMETRFETERLRQENLTKQADLDAAHARTRTRNVIIASLVLLTLALLVIGLNLLKQQRLRKQQSEQDAIIRMQNERLRISRDLHDNIGAQMTYIISSLDKMEWQQKKGNPVDAQILAALGEFARETMDQLRDTVWAMKQETISMEDLISRLRSHCSKIEELTHLKVEFEYDGQTHEKLETSRALDIYRIVQEALQNAMKHARASVLKVTFIQLDAFWRISIQDNGIGFKRDESIPGNGLMNMEHRASDKGFDLRIESIPDQGTTVDLKVPAVN